ncbi:PQ loop repeat domain-containing protein [Trichoderma sp. SZMC 28014]
MVAFLPFISAVFGWIYTLAWSLSFYPQPLLNWQRRSTSGTTADFPTINVIGFAAYFVSNTAFYYSPLVRSQYAARNNGLTPTVAFNDIVFAAHALVLSLITASQYLFRPLWGFESSSGARPSRFISGIIAGCALGVLISCVIVWATPSGNPATDWCELDIVYAAGYVKLLVTLVKFTPQILANYRNKSTRGWSIWQILLDVVGGILSLAQLGIDSYLQHDWSGVTGNPVKLLLGNCSLFFDSIFMFQHYVIYSGKVTSDEEQRLLPEEDRRHRD